MINKPLEEAPPQTAEAPKPAPKKEEQPQEQFPVTKYELPKEETVEDLGPQPEGGEKLTYPEEQTPQKDLGVSEPTTPVEPEQPKQEVAAAPEAPAAPPPAPEQPKMVSVSFDAVPLFNFDKSEVRSDQQQKLDELVAKLNDADYREVWAIGHTDRIGTVAYNQKLSERRANSVKAYLVRQGIPAAKIRTLGRSKHEPVTKPEDCKGKHGKMLIACYQPDRRVDVTVQGQKSSQ